MSRFNKKQFLSVPFCDPGYRYNLDMILFWGPWAPFANSYHLKEDYKNSHKRKELAEELSQRILYIGKGSE